MSQARAAATLVPTILAGGSGTRLWPVSRAAFPKHLVELFGEESLLQTTARRALGVAPADRVVTVAAAGQAVLVRRQYQAIDPRLQEHLLLEPSARNTAAAVALATLHAEAAFGPDSVLWVCPSDHLMLDRDALYRALHEAVAAAAAGWLVTFGITPSRPETGFGWIAPAEELPEAEGVRRVHRFVEKPDREIAGRLLAEGGSLWNSGMFVFRADRMLEELDRWAPDILAATRAACPVDAAAAPAEGLDAAAYGQVRAQPIDKAVMERSARVAVVPADPKWSDVGSWHAIWELMDKDEHGNARQGDTVAVAARDNLVRSEKRLVALAGVSDLAVVETSDALLVVDRRDSEAVRGVVDALAKAGRKEALCHARETRPWGQFTVLQEGHGFKVKEVVVDGHGQLTFQYHPGRDETWVVVEGEALVQLDGHEHRLAAGQSVTVPRGTRHRLSNPGARGLRLIEIGYGEALGDDDTVRLED
ncbi:MAG TPA: mannose-1-phosphate guanylyltransferase/mannose-6-phosphate isomerase [Geminicoccaceae bacterium]|nr:mannose-1-phosphate guanylyltransferase/mannose-6-phosphate isomerase [Geminicoccaceae bacterium]